MEKYPDIKCINRTIGTQVKIATCFYYTSLLLTCNNTDTELQGSATIDVDT